MAYALRPDDPFLVDVEVAPGRVIPMPRAIAEQAGHVEGPPSLFDPKRGALAFTGDTPLDNSPYAENASDTGSAGAPSVAPAQTDVGAGGSSSRGADETAGRGQTVGSDTQSGTAPAQAPAPKEEPKASEGAVRGGGKLVQVPDPEQGGALRRGYGGGRGRVVQLSRGGDVRASFVREPGQNVPEAEEVRALLTGDQYSEGAQQRAAVAGMTPEEIFLAQSQGTLDIDTHDRETANIVELQQKNIQARQANIQQEQEAIKREEDRRVNVDKMIRARQDLIKKRDDETSALTPQSAKEVWASKSTFSQIGAAIMMALGGYLQGLQGRQDNPGYRMLMDGITQEVNDQRAKYEAAVARGEQARGDYADAIAVYGSPEAAALEISNKRLEAAAKLSENAAREIGSREYQQAAALQAQALRAQRAEVLVKLNALENGRIVQENYQYAPAQYAQIGGGTVKPQHRALAVTLPDGSQAFARSPEQARAAQAEIRANAAVAEGASRLRHLAQQPGAKTDPAFAGKINTANKLLQLGLKEQKKLGTLDKGSEGVLETLTGDPTSLLDLERSGAKLEELEQNARQGIHDTIRYELQSGPETLDPVIGAEPTGTGYEE